MRDRAPLVRQEIKVVIARDADRVERTQPSKNRRAFEVVAKQIATEQQRVHLPHRREAGLERGEISMHVGENAQPHGDAFEDRARTSLAIPSASGSCDRMPSCSRSRVMSTTAREIGEGVTSTSSAERPQAVSTILASPTMLVSIPDATLTASVTLALTAWTTA